MAKLGRLVGIGGALVCSLSMVAAAVGLFVAGSTAATQGMAGMGSGHQGGRANADSGHHGGSGRDGMADMGSKHQGGAPEHQGAAPDAGSERHSVAKAAPPRMVGTPLALRPGDPGRLRAVGHGLGDASTPVGSLARDRRGLILYVGMYAQPNLLMMYAAIVVGTGLLVLAFVASLHPTTKEVDRRTM